MNETMTETLEATGVTPLNDLLKACLAAQETYGVAIRRIEKRHDQAAIALRVLQQDHSENVHKIQKLILSLGGDPKVLAAPTALVTRAMEGVVSLFGDVSALRPLRDEEERCLEAARRAEPFLDDSPRSLLEMHLIPRLEKHVELLDALMSRS